MRDVSNLLRLSILGAALSLSGCGVTYTSPSVKEQAAGAKVRVMRLTAESVLLANRQPYTPRALPAAFYQTSGTGQLGDVADLPTQPFIPDESLSSAELRVPPPPPNEPYRIGVGDVVILATKSGGSTVAELTGLLAAESRRQGYTVRDDGAIAIPDIGQVQIAGLTIQQAEDEVFQVLVSNQLDPAFSLEVSEFNSKRVSIGGAVNTPTLVPISLNTLNLNEAVTAAGGLSIGDEQFGLIRIYRDGTLYQIPMNDFYRDPGLQRLRLANGDSVFVDTSYNLDRALEYYREEINVYQLETSAQQQALSQLESEIDIRRGELSEQRSNFQARSQSGAEQRDYIYLAGEVAKQSRFTMPYSQQVTLADVLYANGGFNTATADASEIYVLRGSPNPADFGAITAWHLDLANAANITIGTRMLMHPNDIVFIEEQPITKWGRALQQALPTLFNTAIRAVSD